MKFTEVFHKNAEAIKDARVIVHQGGRGSSKTTSLLQTAYWTASKYQKILFSIVSESMPHLARGAERELFEKILKPEGLYRQSLHNMSKHEYKPNGTIEFFGADKPDKFFSANRDYLYMNEADRLTWQTFQDLEVRTEKKIYIDFNPRKRFWAHTELPQSKDVRWIYSTYKDNPFLPENIVRSIEAKREKYPNWWRVYGEGQLGEVEGLIFNFDIVDEPDGDLLGAGLDFGFTNDPSASVKVYRRADDIYLDEIFYEFGLTNPEIAGKVKGYKVIADSAEPKSIEEIRRLGVNIHPSVKGRDSVIQGIQLIQQYNLHVTKRSVNLIHELENYTWEVDRSTGKSINVPVDFDNHAIEAVRGLIQTVLMKKKNTFYIAGR